MTEPRRPPDVLAVKPLYGCCRSMGGTSVLAWRGEVRCRCVRHLDAPWCRRTTRRLFATPLVWRRHHRLAVGVLSIPLTRRVWFCRHRSTKVLLPGIMLTRYPDTMKEGLSVLPRDPDVLCSEVTPSVQQLLPDVRVRSGLTTRVGSGLFLVLPRLVHHS